MHHVLIGGNGFLGREVARQLSARGDTALVVDLEESYKNFPKADLPGITYGTADIAAPAALASLQLAPTDIVHHLATKLIVPNQPRFNRDAHFRICAVEGTRNLLAWMQQNKNRNLVFWSSDMVYGPALWSPRTEDHPRHPYGPYGRSKVAAEDLVATAVTNGSITATIFRPRLIIGPGRLGILETLFKFAERGWPIPLIGPGRNQFQFVAVSDCARASILAADKGCPNGTYNLGSENAPTVHALMQDLIKTAQSRSWLIRTPGWMVKGTLRALNAVRISPMDPEQFEIADQDVALDISAAARDLGWRPTLHDSDQLAAAFRSYKQSKTK